MRNMLIPTLAFAVIVISPLQAQHVPRMSDAEVANYLERGQELESRTDGDVNLDGESDTMIVGRSDDKRTLKVMLAIKSEADLSHQPVGELDLDTYPQGPADISIAKGVLKVIDLTGGTTATQATYRYRYDPAVRKMRLIGLDATNYSRTYAHDGYEVSWNLLTGDLVTRDMKLSKKGGDAAYDPIIEKKGKRPSKPLYMEDTPNPDDLIAAVRK